MGAKYKFVCSSCKFQCISGIGTEVGSHHLEVVMACRSCATIDGYTLAKPGSIHSELNKKPVCKTCHSADYLDPWDGLTCPHCKMKMRALGSDINAEKTRFKYW